MADKHNPPTEAEMMAAVSRSREEDAQPLTFRLSLDLGSEAMSTAEHISEALSMVARRLGDGDDGIARGASAPIRDVNGNTVGRWEVS